MGCRGPAPKHGPCTQSLPNGRACLSLRSACAPRPRTCDWVVGHHTSAPSNFLSLSDRVPEWWVRRRLRILLNAKTDVRPRTPLISLPCHATLSPAPPTMPWMCWSHLPPVKLARLARCRQDHMITELTTGPGLSRVVRVAAIHTYSARG